MSWEGPKICIQLKSSFVSERKEKFLNIFLVINLTLWFIRKAKEKDKKKQHNPECTRGVQHLL